MAGASTYKTINGQKILVDDWRRIQTDALRDVTTRLGRPVSPDELAAELGVPAEAVTHMSLVHNGHALLRRIPGVGAKGLWPRDTMEPRMVEAYRAFRKIPVGTRLEWTEPRRDSARRPIERTLTVSRTYQSRLRSALRRAIGQLGIGRLRDVESHHLPLLAEAVWTLEMQGSPLPRDQWHSKSETARRVRKSAGNRRSEVMQFLSWAEWQGFATLSHLGSRTLPEAWCAFVARVGDTEHAVAARRIATISYRGLQADRPERLVEIGFDRLEAELLNDPKYASEQSARTTISRLRRAWNACAEAPGQEPLAAWSAGEPRGVRRRIEDGGLMTSWWSADAFFEGRSTLLDHADMKDQRRQAIDLKDWWMLSDPTLRPVAAGGPLPARPEKSKKGLGRKPFGARSPDERTAVKPLMLVSKFQRWAMNFDEPEYQLSQASMQAMEWADLFRDRARVKRFIRWIFQSNQEMNRQRSGAAIITAGVRIAWYVHTLMWAYFPAFERQRITRLRAIKDALDFGCPSALQESQRIDAERNSREDKIAWWEAEADEIRKYILDITIEYGGIVPVKQKTEVREHLNHREILRMADHFRDRRLEREERLRSRTAALLNRVERARAVPCQAMTGADRCGVVGCDIHHALPSLSPRGLAYSVMDRTYCKLITKEAMLRLPAILPWRPSTFRRAVLGVHLDPDTLLLSVVGRDGKVDRDARGEIKRQRVPITDLEWWEDPSEIEKTIEVLRLLIDEARVWVHANPTKTGMRLRHERDRQRLFLNSYGAPWRTAGTFGQSFKDAVTEAARGVNANLREGEAPIVLPTSWGSRGSYTPRFLYGHRIKEKGGTYDDISQALGNSVWTAQRHYQDEQHVEGLNRTTRELRDRDIVNPVDRVAELEHKLSAERAAREALETRLSAQPAEQDGSDYGSSLTRLLRAKDAGEIAGTVFSAALASLNARHGIKPT